MKKILLVDDDNIFNFISTKLLEKSGLASEIHIAGNGQNALRFLTDCYIGAASLPDVILLDLNMPVMDGFTFLETFQSLDLPGKERVRIVIVTSSIDNKEMARANQLGVSLYLTKPLSEASVVTALEG